MSRIYISIFLLSTLIALPTVIRASCDCSSTDPINPCLGNSITVLVNASSINGSSSTDAIFEWKFNSGGEAASCGKFANGDYWIAPGPGKSSVEITNISSLGAGKISADADPVLEKIGLLDGSNKYGNYIASENIVPILPLTYTTTTSLVAAIQRDESKEGVCGTSRIVGECVDAYNVVTVLPSIPARCGVDMLRPNISGDSKQMLHLSDFDFSLLPSLSYLSGTDPVGLERIRERWAHSIEIFGLVSASGKFFSEGGRAFRSHILVDDYAGGTASQWYNEMMVLLSDDNSLSEKMPAISSILTYGLDLYHAMYNTTQSRYFGVGATQHAGKFMPVVLFASLLKDPSFADKLKEVRNHVRDNHFSGPHELAQIQVGPNGPVWGDTLSYGPVQQHGSYWGNVLASRCYDNAPVGTTCNPTLGKKTQKDPYGYIDGPPNKPGTSYMISTLGTQRSFVAMMWLIPKIREVVNYEEIIKYIDRVDTQGIQVLNDPCVTPDSREDPTQCDPYRNTGCKYYGVTWGPVDPTDENSTCITIETPPYTKAGRFTSLQGTMVKPSYTSSQVEKNWSKIKAQSILGVPRNFHLFQ